MTDKCLNVVSRFQEPVHQLNPLFTILVYYCYLIRSRAVRKWQLFMGFERGWALRQTHSRSLKRFGSFCHAGTKTCFSRVFLYALEMGDTECLVWFVHFQKGYPSWSLEYQSRNKLRAGSPFLPKCLVRCSRSYSQEQIVCSWDSHLIHWSCLICSIVPGPAWPEKPC